MESAGQSARRGTRSGPVVPPVRPRRAADRLGGVAVPVPVTDNPGTVRKAELKIVGQQSTQDTGGMGHRAAVRTAALRVLSVPFAVRVGCGRITGCSPAEANHVRHASPRPYPPPFQAAPGHLIAYCVASAAAADAASPGRRQVIVSHHPLYRLCRSYLSGGTRQAVCSSATAARAGPGHHRRHGRSISGGIQCQQSGR